MDYSSSSPDSVWQNAIWQMAGPSLAQALWRTGGWRDKKNLSHPHTGTDIVKEQLR